MELVDLFHPGLVFHEFLRVGAGLRPHLLHGRDAAGLDPGVVIREPLALGRQAGARQQSHPGRQGSREDSQSGVHWHTNPASGGVKDRGTRTDPFPETFSVLATTPPMSSVDPERLTVEPE